MQDVTTLTRPPKARRPRASELALQASLVAVLLLATFLRYWKLASSSFGFDAAALSSLAARFVATGVPPAQGMVSSVGIQNPPFAVYLISLPVLFSRNPTVLIGFVALINVVGVWACYRFTRHYWGAWEGILAGLLLACSPWAVYYSRGVWAQDLLVPGVILFFALLLHWLIDGRAWALSAAMVTLALLVQIHFAALALAPVLVVVLLANRFGVLGLAPQPRFWRSIGAGLGICAALYAPYLVASARGDTSAISAVVGGSGTAHRISLQAVEYALMNIGGRNIHALAGPKEFEHFLATAPALRYWPDRIEEALVLLGAVYLAVRCWRQRASRTALARDVVLLLWLILPVLFFVFLPTETYPHYLVPLYPAPYIALAVAVFDFGRWVAQRPSGRVLLVIGVLALVVLVGWQGLLTARLYELADAVDTPGGLGTPARVYSAVSQVIDRYTASHPQTKVAALCPGRDPQWADPRWDECPAVLDFVAGQKRPISYINYTAATPAVPETNEDLLVVVAPGGEAAAARLSQYATPLPNETVPVRSGAGEYRFFEVHNRLRDVVDRLEAWGRAEDAVLLSIPGGRERFSAFYSGPLPVAELPRSPENETTTLAELVRASERYPRLFVVYQGSDNGDPGGLVDNWLSEHGYKAVDAWLGDVRLAMYATAAPAGSGAQNAVNVDLGGQLRLVASEITPGASSITPGDILQVQLTWQVLRSPDADYSSFLQLIDADGRVLAQSDSLLSHQNELTHAWQPGSTVETRRGLLIPKDATPGRYRLITGLYRADQPGLPRLSGPDADYVNLAQVDLR